MVCSDGFLLHGYFAGQFFLQFFPVLFLDGYLTIYFILDGLVKFATLTAIYL